MSKFANNSFVINKFNKVLKHVFAVLGISVHDIWMFNFKLKFLHQSLAAATLKIKNNTFAG